jgi:outer membrane protein OmpA-like peptidoglycan-associated protein
MKRVYTVFSFLLIVALVHGQYDPKENFYDAEFFLAEEDYTEALYAFNQVYKDGYENNSNINYRIGFCLVNIDGRKSEAIPYLNKAILNITEKYKEGVFKEENAPPDAYLLLGNAYRIDNQFDKSIESYNKYLDYIDEEDVELLYVDLQIEACKLAKIAVTDEGDYDIGTLGQVNLIRAPVYHPVVSGDLSTFAFMGKQKFYNGVYVSRKQNGKWLRPYNITPSIQSDGNQTVLSLSHDGSQILLSWADQFESDIWITEFKNDRWYHSQPMSKPINSKYYESHACFTPDGNTIYFTSNRKESLGDMDIFKCEKNDDGTWGELMLLGENVNTPLNEDRPFISPDGKRIYFSSQGHQGLGGFDVFYCDINADGTFNKAVNLTYPLNTPDDDFTFSPKNVEFEDYITIYAKGENDQVDLFRFEWIPDEAQAVIVKFESTEEEVIEEVVEELPEEVAEVVEEIVEEIVEEVAVVVEETETYLIKPIFFEFDSYGLTEAELEKLNGLSSILSKFPTLKIEIIGHTDNVGNRGYNESLAQKRAKAVAKQLTTLGIDESRLMVASRGELEPIALNRTTEDYDAPIGRALNRRVHFNVSVPNGLLIEIDNIDVPDNLKIN